MALTRINLGVLYAIAFAVPMLATLWLTPVAARIARRLGMMDHPAKNKYHQTATPSLGGLALAVGLVLVGGVAVGAEGQLLTVLLSGLVLAIVGLLDDQLLVRPLLKLIVEIAAGVAMWLVGVRAGLFGVEVLDLGLTVLWVVAITNAINLLDNMDGLCAGVSAICAVTFFTIAAVEGDYLVASLALSVAGASLGFLRHNFPPARIFLGDIGTLLLGFLLAALGLKLDLVGENGFLRSAVPVLILGVPIFDLLLVIVARAIGRRPIYAGGTDHSSHRMASLGFSNRAVALVAYAMQLASSLLGLSLLWIALEAAMGLVIGVSAVAVVGMVLLLRVKTLGERGVTQPEAFHVAGRPLGRTIQ
jgi:UDP-GlcNAc:undecaprenyl-phosphate/decaprenyl-phosphate GlcNAc-1-phosphate transferase